MAVDLIRVQCPRCGVFTLRIEMHALREELVFMPDEPSMDHLLECNREVE